LTDAMAAVGLAWRERGGAEVRFSLAASSTLARQIEAGAPADVFASASEEWMDYLADRGLIEPGSRSSPVGNSLVLIAPAADATGAVEIGPGLDLGGLLGPAGRLAVGDTAHVPAGIYARQALESLGLWPAVRDRLAMADNVRAALALVERGEAPLGIVYATDARISAAVRVVGAFPQGSHPPITYPVAIVQGRRSPEVEDFLAFVGGQEAGEIFARLGFQPAR
jgi:molybdate transport system substrate-binding protein